MKVFKFGGASVKDANAVKNVGSILKKYQNEKLLVVISAMGKTTNALELVVKNYFEKSTEVNTTIQVVKDYHNQILLD